VAAAVFGQPAAGHRHCQGARPDFGSAWAGTADGVTGNGQDRDEPGPPPSRGDKRLYFVLMGICLGLFVLSWAVLERFSVTAAVIVSVVALAIPPFAAIVANAGSATDRRRR
jgi:Protein of unknown function (DUF3099)